MTRTGHTATSGIDSALPRSEHDLDAVMDELIEHAREVVARVWPGGTVDVDDIEWFWNRRLSRHTGMAYSYIPSYLDSDRTYAIGLDPTFYQRRGMDAIKELVRHELIHVWQYAHPDCPDSGHGRTFTQWVDDLDTHR